MAINVDLVYRSVLEIIQKNLGSGYLSPSAFDIQASMANVELFNKYAEIYQNQQQITDKLIFFIKKAVLSIDDTTGRMAHPPDYVDEVAVRAFNPDDLDAATEECDDENPIDYNKLRQIKVKIIDNDKLGDRLNSLVLAPDRNHPIATFYDSYVQFYPCDLGTCIFEYLRQPIEPIWGFTIDSNGLEVYDPSTSTDFEWPWKMRNEVIIKICEYFGISVREGDLIQSTQLMESQQA